jgi:hypothetical protein
MSRAQPPPERFWRAGRGDVLLADRGNDRAAALQPRGKFHATAALQGLPEIVPVFRSLLQRLVTIATNAIRDYTVIQRQCSLRRDRNLNHTREVTGSSPVSPSVDNSKLDQRLLIPIASAVVRLNAKEFRARKSALHRLRTSDARRRARRSWRLWPARFDSVAPVRHRESLGRHMSSDRPVGESGSVSLQRFIQLRHRPKSQPLEAAYDRADPGFLAYPEVSTSQN